MHQSIGRLARPAAFVIVATIVAACTVATPPPILGSGPPPMGLRTAKGLGVAPVKGAAVKIAFATVTGTPAELRFELEDSLKKDADTRSLVIVPADDPTATYIVKGYMSAIGDANQGNLIYVFDVFDRTGVARHRITGQKAVAGSGSDPWAAVTNADIHVAAQETIDDLAGWLRGL